MKTIDEYIALSKGMENTSVGGSAAYHFLEDGVVLVKYVGYNEYGMAREGEEYVRDYANAANANGVRTPIHIAIKREINGEANYCWVLQECAKGVSFTEYSSSRNEPSVQLERQRELANAPDAHYDQCIRDICALFDIGMEYKAKNIYYDPSKEDGGFTFIDLLDYRRPKFNPDSLADILHVAESLNFLYNVPHIYDYKNRIDKAITDESEFLRLTIRLRMFKAMERTIPGFSKYRRDVLRSYPKDELAFFASQGLDIGDLTLTDEEQKNFHSEICRIVGIAIKKIENGECKFWEIGANEIRIALSKNGLNNSWMYHPANQAKRTDYESDYEYKYACDKHLERIVNDLFNKKLAEIAKDSDNEKVLEAKQDLDKYLEQQRRMNKA